MSAVTTVEVPDIGDFRDVEIIEVLVAVGDRIALEDPLITLESDKASIEIPASAAGVIKRMRVKRGDRVSQGDPILEVEPIAAVETSAGASATPTPADAAMVKTAAQASGKPGAGGTPMAPAGSASGPVTGGSSAARPLATEPPSPLRTSPTEHLADARSARKVHASPAVRRFARDLGVELGKVDGSGRKKRILKEDVQAFVKRSLTTPSTGLPGIEPAPEIDFSSFGPVELQPLTRINRLAGRNLHRNWVTVPHVTQFDEADITELEAFRKSLRGEYEKQGVKMTFLPFLMKAVVSVLKQYPRFNASLDASGDNLILKRYFHLGVAVDTPDGLVVPVIRDVDRKSLVELAAELMEVSKRARDRKLRTADLQGGCMTISSLGGIGGTNFTPIVNSPEVAILGVARSSMQPVWTGTSFEPRLILPLALSYDHRVIDGALGARFTSALSGLLSDMRRMLL